MNWTAQWIWHPDTDSMNNFYMYARHSLTLASAPSNARVFVTASSLYKLFINGTYVGRGPNPSDPSRYYFDSQDVTSLLRPGVNVIAAVCYNYDTVSPGIIGQNHGRGGFLCQLQDIDGAVLAATSASWKLLQAPPWDQQAPINCTLYADYKESYDSRKEIEGWMDAEFDDSTWVAPHVIGATGCQPWTELIEREIPALTTEKLYPVNATWESAAVTYAWRDDWEVYHEQRLCPQSPYRTTLDTQKPMMVRRTHADFSPSVTLDFGRDVSGYVKIVVKDSKGGTIDLCYGEGSYFVRVDRFILKGGPQTLEPFNRRTFRYLKLVFADTPDTVEIDEVLLEMSAYPVNNAASSFRCSDDQLNRIYDVAKYTMRLSMLDHFVDCPWRERTIYGGDHYDENLISFYAFGDSRLNAKTLRQMFHLQYDDGAVPPYGPYRHEAGGFYAAWSAFTGLAFTDHYRLTGDRAFLKELWPRFSQLVNWAITETTKNPLGLIGSPESNLPYRAWIAAPRTRFEPWTNCPFRRLVANAAELAHEAGDPAAADRWLNATTALTTALRTQLFDPPSGQTCSLHGDNRSLCGQYETALMVWCGALEPRDGLFASRNMFAADTVRIGSPFHGFFVLDALFDNGEDGAAIDFMRRFWGAMLNDGATTFYEHYTLDWPAGTLPDRQNSQCHGWSAAPAYTLPARVLGVQPLAPGFRRVLIEPQTAGLAWASGVVPTPAGALRVSWQQSKQLLRMDIDAPESCELVISLAASRGRTRKMRIDGKETTFELQGGRQRVVCAGGRRIAEQTEL